MESQPLPTADANDSDRVARQYDAIADGYSADNAGSAFNAFYERPATISLLGQVHGQSVLEVGCGSGPLTKWLVNQGADVTAFDVSPAMVRLAQAHVGSRAHIFVADLVAPLTFAQSHTAI
ncbi:MAG: class I SAM-dependent methyltransferase [Chloroflexota bacterium]